MKKFIEIHEKDNVEIGWHPHIYKEHSKTKFENNEMKSFNSFSFLIDCFFRLTKSSIFLLIRI